MHKELGNLTVLLQNPNKRRSQKEKKELQINQIEEQDCTCSTKVCKKIKNQALYLIAGFFRNCLMQHKRVTKI